MRKTWKSRVCQVTYNSLWRHSYGHQNWQCVHFPLTTFSEMGFLRTSGIPWCLALPWAFRALVCRKSLSFLDLGDPSSSALVGEKTELKISYWRGIAPSTLCRSYTPLPVPLCWQDGGWAERGHNRITGGWVEGSPVTDPSHFPSIRKRLALFEHIFRRPLSHHHAFRWQHWQLRLTRCGYRGGGEGRLCPKIAFSHPSKINEHHSHGVLQSDYTDIIWLNGRSYYTTTSMSA